MKSASICALFMIIAISCVNALRLGGVSPKVLAATPEVQAIAEAVSDTFYQVQNYAPIVVFLLGKRRFGKPDWKII